MNIRAIIMDLDRTLLHTDKTVSAYTLDVLKRCKNAGIAVMIATARPLRDVVDYIDLLEADAVTAMNGAKIICKDVVENYELDASAAEHILEKLCKLNVPLSLEMGNEVYSNEVIPEYESIIVKDFPKLPNGEAPYKILVNRVNDDILYYVESILPEDMYYTVAIGKMVQIMRKQATKWNGIQNMLRANGCSPEEAIYFGDDHDDVDPSGNAVWAWLLPMPSKKQKPRRIILPKATMMMGLQNLLKIY